MSNKDLVSTSNTLVSPPPPATQTIAELTTSAKAEAGKAAMSKIASGDVAGFDSLNQSAKDAFSAYGLLPAGDEREPQAKQAALDALRDAKAAGSFSTAATPVNAIAESKDPAVRNQAPAGTPNQDSGTGTTFLQAPSAAPPALSTSSSTEPNTTTPAVKGSRT